MPSLAFQKEKETSRKGSQKNKEEKRPTLNENVAKVETSKVSEDATESPLNGGPKEEVSTSSEDEEHIPEVPPSLDILKSKTPEKEVLSVVSTGPKLIKGAFFAYLFFAFMFFSDF